MKSGYQIAVSIFLALSIAIYAGCSTMGKSVGAGALAGGVTGAGVGALADPGSQGRNRFRNVVIGTSVGSAVGAGTGFLLDQLVKGEREIARNEGKKEALEANQARATASEGALPRLIQARTEAHWIPDQVHGTTFIPAHFEYQIVEGARWDTGKE